MDSKPTYEELIQRVRELEKEISECERVNATLRQSEERYRLLVNGSPMGILTIDTQGRIIEINPKTLEILGSPSANATRAINLFEFPLLVETGISSDFRRCLQSGQSIVAERPYVTKWGKPVHLRYHLTPIFNPNGQIIGVQAVHEDFTRLKHAEEAIKKHKEHLEDLVRERTAELIKANEELLSTVKKLEWRTNEILLLNQLSELLQACESEQETYSVVNSICQRLFPADSGYLGILDNSAKVLRVMGSWGDHPPGDREFDQNHCWAIRRGKVHFVQYPEIDPVCPHLKELPAYGCLCAPMSAQGEVLGMMHLCMGPRNPSHSEEDHRHVLESKRLLVVSIVERYAPSLTSLRLRETLRMQSIRDPLTNGCKSTLL